MEKLEKCGLIYTRVLGEGDDSSSPIGRGWQSVFATSDKVVDEERYAFFISFNIANKLSRAEINGDIYSYDFTT